MTIMAMIISFSPACCTQKSHLSNAEQRREAENLRRFHAVPMLTSLPERRANAINCSVKCKMTKRTFVSFDVWRESLVMLVLLWENRMNLGQIKIPILLITVAIPDMCLHLRW